ncbi:hypothetical protein FRC06_009320 [Ceratobasidium sp. 370]|nr:hypothetical protein FRC06_009320 [Ceratobasidium sp. 370]
MLNSSDTRVPSGITDPAPPIPPEFYNGVASLATAADSLSKAAEAMAAAARAMSEASQAFGTLNVSLLGVATEKDEAGDESTERLGRVEHEAEGMVESGPDNSQTWSNYHSPPQPQAIFGAFLPFSDPLTNSSGAKGSQSTPNPAKSESQTRPPNEGEAVTGLIPDALGAQKPENSTRTLGPAPEKPISAAASGRDVLTGTTGPTMKQLSLQESVNNYPKLPPGRNYIHLEESFDALPIISYMALASRKTICLVPSSGSLSSYQTILNAITGLKVFEQAIDQFLDATSPTILLLPFTAIPAVFRQTAQVDCVVHWGWPCNSQNWSALATSVKRHARFCLLIPSGQHLKPAIDSAASDYGVKRYSADDLRSFLGLKSPIHEIRKETIRVLTKTDPEIMKTLYHSWLSYYGAGPNRRTDWTVADLIDYGREYAAKTLLQGWPSDGSKVHPPVSTRRLPLPDWVIERAATSTPQVSAGRESLSAASAWAPPPSPHSQQSFLHPSPNPVPPPRQPVPSSSSMPSSAQLPGNSSVDLPHPGRYFVVLEEEFDAIPLISYLAIKNKKTICYVASPESPRHYKDIFEATTNLAVTFPTAIKYANKMQTQLASASRPTMLIQFYWALHSAGLQKSTANAVICLGVPADIESYVKGAAQNVAHSYLVLNANEYSDPRVRASFLRLGITAHPASTIINDHSANSLLGDMRRKTMAFFKTPGFSSIAKSLYYFFISYYTTGQGRPDGLTPEDIARAANTYAAKLLLHGRREDGSNRYPPIASRPRLSSGAIKAFKLKKAMSIGLVDSE